jgi:ribosome-associated protein
MNEIPVSDFKMLTCICQSLFDKKGFNILALDLRHLGLLTDYFVIAEGSVEKHVQALSHAVCEEMLECGEKPYHVEGKTVGEWIVIDYSTIMIHLFIPEMREKYELEHLWHEAKIVDVPINTSHVKSDFVQYS